MNRLDRFASRKLLTAACAILIVAANHAWTLGLTTEDVRSITDIALAAIGSQAGIDLIERIAPMVATKTRSTPPGGNNVA